MEAKSRHVALLSVAILAALGVSSAVAGGRSDLVLAALGKGTPHIPGELLVQFKPGAAESDIRAVRAGVNAERLQVVRDDAQGRLELLRMAPGLAVADAVRGLDGDAAVEFAEPNWIYFPSVTSNDTYYSNGSLYGMYGEATNPANQFGSQAGEAWALGRTNCGSVYVGVIDEGYMHTHEDLAANAGTTGDVAANGIDDDGNGFVDDVNGWDFDGGNNSVFDGLSDDHGTHVAGTIGGVGGNAKGVAGVCWNVKIINAKFLGSNGGTTANAIAAVDYMTGLKTRPAAPLNLVATNNSWGGGGFSQGLQDAITRANAAGILFIAAAGNSGTNNDTTASYPSNYEVANVIAVAATTNTGALASYSQFGATTVDLGAPGSGIWSTVPIRSKGKTVSGYASYSGTSMATPHVTGAAALYAAYHAGSTAAQIKSAILSTVVPTASLAGKTVTGGRLNVSSF